MLRELSIRQFAIVEEVNIEFENGFHVLTGETGAGKSILLDALGLVLGGRSSSEYVRHGAQKAEVEAYFELESDHPVWAKLVSEGIETEEDGLIIRREVSENGKSTARINGKMVTRGLLREVGSLLVQIHGQHEHQTLLHVDEHIELLDHYGTDGLRELRKQYEEWFHQAQTIEKRLKSLELNQQELAHKIDLYQFQLQELREARLVPGEEEELRQEQKKLSFGEKLQAKTEVAYQALTGESGGLDRIRWTAAQLSEISDVDEEVQEAFQMVEAAAFQLEEAVHFLSQYREKVEYNPERLHEVQDRLHTIQNLKRKYGEDVEEMIAYQEKVEQELENLTHHEDHCEELRQERDLCRGHLVELADKMTQLRKEAAVELEKKVEQELGELQMGNAVFHISFQTPTKTLYHRKGKDHVEFHIAPNPGEPLRPLAKIASGGEISRIMLALQSIFSGRGPVHTYVFDEIDTGVSGRAAQAIAEKIAKLAAHVQVLCVTHLPQVACMADRHFYISKQIMDSSTRTTVVPLRFDGRQRELARMLGGVEVTETTLEHAEEMLLLADQVKRKVQRKLA